MRSLLCFVTAGVLVGYVCYTGYDAKHFNLLVRQSSYPFLASLALSLSVGLAGLGAFIGGVSGLFLLRKQ